MCMSGQALKLSVRATQENTLLKSDVTTRDHVVRCRGSQECGSRNVNFAQSSHNSEIYNILVHAPRNV